MISAFIPANEQDRIKRLAELGILDTLEEQVYDDLTHLAAQICSTPIALISLIDKDRQWFKSHHGLEVRETPREVAFCAHAILEDGLFIVEDSFKDVRFRDNPLATGAPNVRFYAGAPLVMENNVSLGTLCVIDNEPRVLTPAQLKSLAALARQVIVLLDLRMKVSELEILDRAKNEFVAMVNHELRTPLSSIQGSLHLLEKEFRSTETRSAELVNIASRNADRLMGIVNDILDIAKMEAGKLKISMGPLDLVEILRNALTLSEAYVSKHECKMILSVPDGDKPVMVHADEQRITQVMYNLLSNAAKFSQPGCEIKIRLDLKPGFARVSVQDEGCGIEPEHMDKLFSKFHQFSTGDGAKHPGTGLGLNICRHLLELHESTITCTSTPQVGSTFSFNLKTI